MRISNTMFHYIWRAAGGQGPPAPYKTYCFGVCSADAIPIPDTIKQFFSELELWALF
jgi:hypothetical protein